MRWNRQKQSGKSAIVVYADIPRRYIVISLVYWTANELKNITLSVAIQPKIVYNFSVRTNLPRI